MFTGYRKGICNGKVYYSVVHDGSVIYTYKESRFRQYTEYVAKRSFESNKRINSIVIPNKNYCELILFKNDKEYKVKIDKEYSNIIEENSWHITSKDDKIIAVSGKYGLTLGRFILGVDKNKESKKYVVDILNNDKLDYRKENLRYVSKEESSTNRSLFCNNSTGKRGIYRYKDHYEVHVKCNGKRHRKRIGFGSKRNCSAKRTEDEALKLAIKYRDELISKLAFKKGK